MEKIKRIEYIDALRGFTMLLVVFSHIIVYGYHFNNYHGLNDFFILFRMPLFFFISGFILYKPTNIEKLNLKTFLKQKFLVQIIPTIVIGLLYTYCFDSDINSFFFQSTKNGYWFTLVLFEFFLFYSFAIFLLRIFHFNNKAENFIYILVLMLVLVLFVLISINSIDYFYTNLFCWHFLKYFLYFTLGIFIRKYFKSFEILLGKSWFISFTIFMLLVLYLLYTDYIFYSSLPKIIKLMNSSLIAVLGIILIFCFFREKQNLFASSTTLGYVLQFVGKRTLDVYLLHYFFLPRNLNCIGYFF